MKRLHGSDGSAMIVTLLVVPVTLAIAGWVFDPTFLLTDKGRAFAVANAAARAGANEVSPEALRQGRLALDPAAAEAAARRYLVRTDWSGAVNATSEQVVVDVEGFRRGHLLTPFGFPGKRVHAVGAAKPVEATSEAP